MDEIRFDALTRSLSVEHSRRSLAQVIVGFASGGLLSLQIRDIAAKRGGKGKKGKGKKVTVCHQGRTVKVAKSSLQTHLGHGDVKGKCGCAGRDENDACADAGVSGVCCGGDCTPLGTLDNCASCGDACAQGDVCSGLGSGGDPDSGCCVPSLTICNPDDPNRCCNGSTCTEDGLDNHICCVLSGGTCAILGHCCSGTCGASGTCS